MHFALVLSLPVSMEIIAKSGAKHRPTCKVIRPLQWGRGTGCLTSRFYSAVLCHVPAAPSTFGLPFFLAVLGLILLIND